MNNGLRRGFGPGGGLGVNLARNGLFNTGTALVVDEMKIGVHMPGVQQLNNGTSVLTSTGNSLPPNVSSAFPGDLGAKLTVGSGSFAVNGNNANFWSVGIHSGPGVQYMSSNNAVVSTIEGIPTVSNTPGVAANLPGLANFVSNGVWTANGAAITSQDMYEYGAGATMQGTNGGTLTTGNYDAFLSNGAINAGAILTNWSSFHAYEAGGGGTITNSYGLNTLYSVGATNNYPISIGPSQTATLTAAFSSDADPAAISIGRGATYTLNFASADFGTGITINPTVRLTQTSSATRMFGGVQVAPTIRNTVGSSPGLGTSYSFQSTPTIGPDTQTGLTGATHNDFRSAATFSQANSGTITATWNIRSFLSTFTMNATGSTVAARTGLLINNATLTAGTITTQTGIIIAALSGATTNTGINNASSLVQTGAFIGGVNTVTVAANAGTVAVTAFVSNFTNSSAANMTITMAVTGASDGQIAIVRVYDASAVSKTITWVNTEVGEATPPAASNGSTTLPKTVMFMFNSASSLWRCIIT